MRRELWEELSPKFPLEHWDHWMRLASTHKGRDCIAPLVSRNYNIGVQGANMDTSQVASNPPPYDPSHCHPPSSHPPVSHLPSSSLLLPQTRHAQTRLNPAAAASYSIASTWSGSVTTRRLGSASLKSAPHSRHRTRRTYPHWSLRRRVSTARRRSRRKRQAPPPPPCSTRTPPTTLHSSRATSGSGRCCL